MTATYTTTFTLTHAKHLASKVVADLYLCSRLYGFPSLASIEAYLEELAILLVGEYVRTYEFGFKREGNRVLSCHYAVGPAGDLAVDSRAGGLVRGVDVSGAHHFNHIEYTLAWFELTPADRQAIKDTLPIQRTSGFAPGDGNGYWTTERTYTAGGVLIERRVFRPW